MIVPNFIPEPLEVPGNVSEERYAYRLIFIRRVTLLHTMGIGAVTALSMLTWPDIGWPVALLVLSITLLATDLLRIAWRGTAAEARWSSLALPIVLGVVSWFVHTLQLAGIPIWAPLAGVGFIFLYTLACRNDYSFLGCWMLSGIGSTVMVAALVDFRNSGTPYGIWALSLNALYLTYYVYDLASLMSRRRRGETLAAVVDLYRDIFNLFGYIPRVISHWRKHKIWLATNR